MTNTITFQVKCPCGQCGETRTATMGGFETTTIDVNVEACPNMPYVKTAVMRKSWGLENAVSSYNDYRHKDGLVTLMG